MLLTDGECNKLILKEEVVACERPSESKHKRDFNCALFKSKLKIMGFSVLITAIATGKGRRNILLIKFFGTSHSAIVVHT